MSSLRHFWGTEPDERLLDFPCDSFKELFDDTCYRGVTIQTNQEIIFRWLCQLRIAIYSLGRKSPPKLTPGLERLAIGGDELDTRGGKQSPHDEDYMVS